MNPVMIMAGGTGGHIFPGLAVADSLGRRGIPVIWLGSAHGMENRIVPEHDIDIETLSIKGLRGKGAATLLLAPFRLLRAVTQAITILRRHHPGCVLSMGGFVAGPGGIAAWLLRRPLVVHEQNRVPGLTNRILSRFACRVLSGFPDAFAAGQAEHTGNPVRREIAEIPDPASRHAHRSGRVRLLVLGGSQGSMFLNQVVPEALAVMSPEERPEVRHQLGQKHLEAGRQAYAEAGVPADVTDFIADMQAAYQWADLVVCRSGALTLAELAAAGVGAMLVPFPHAVDDHQTRNAEFMVAAGGAELLPESMLNARLLANRMSSLLASRDQLQRMAENAHRVARPQAAEQVADVLIAEAR
jgi:UDP-N-acetylglucosamine--N-acetylmuramyl-(pentapeptide) pyrophosphoryl-undecaprenol N-acetylglucosamine transferase